MTTESRLGALEGTTGEHAAAIAGLRDDLREGLADVRAEIRDVRAEVAAVRTEVRAEIREVRAEIRGMRTEVAALNARIDRLVLAFMGGSITIALAQVGVIITVLLRN